MYPIPPPDQETLVQIFGPQVAEDPSKIGPPPGGQTSGAANGACANRPPARRCMAIFELLEHIVNQPPPKLPPKVFSEPMRDFVDRCLRRNANERADLSTLMVNIRDCYIWQRCRVSSTLYLTRTALQLHNALLICEGAAAHYVD